VLVAALRRADPPSKKSYRLSRPSHLKFRSVSFVVLAVWERALSCKSNSQVSDFCLKWRNVRWNLSWGNGHPGMNTRTELFPVQVRRDAAVSESSANWIIPFDMALDSEWKLHRKNCAGISFSYWFSYDRTTTFPSHYVYFLISQCYSSTT
jgi:hypothetical protein